MNDINLLLRHNFIAIPHYVGTSEATVAGPEALATVLMNFSYYGKALSLEGYREVTKLTAKGLASWWMELEPELKLITGASRKIGDFVVYKNFPTEVLDKTTAEYWIPQLLMYWGFPNEYFTQEVAARPAISKKEKTQPTVLRLAKKNTLLDLLNSKLASPARWKDEEWQDVLFLSSTLPVTFAKLAFKENLVKLITHFINTNRSASWSHCEHIWRRSTPVSIVPSLPRETGTRCRLARRVGLRRSRQGYL